MSSFTRSVIFCLSILIMLFPTVFGGPDVMVNSDVAPGPRNEPSITINRYFGSDPLNVVVAYNDLYNTLGISYSADSGYTWTDVQLPYVWSWTGDPSVACDPAGDLYACFLSYEGTWFYGVSGIYVCKSTDGGRNWQSPTKVDELKYTGGAPVKFADKCFITVDTNMTSAYVGNIYVGWQRDDTNGTNSDIFFARSTDGGLSFSTPIQVNDNPSQTAWAEGAFPFVGAGGVVYMTWYDCYFKGNVPGSLYVDISYDGGQTFGTDKKVATFLAPPLYTHQHTAFKAKCFPSAAADPFDPNKLYITYISDPDGYHEVRIDVGDNQGQSQSAMPVITRNGPYVYAAWQDARNGASDIYFNRSTDNGQTWEVAAIGPLENTDTPGANFSWNQRLSYSGQYVYCVWEDYRSASGNANVYFNRSTDYGKTWQTEMNIDLAPTIISERPWIASTGSNVYIVWSDFRNGLNQDILFSRSTNNGASWSAPTRVDLGDNPGQYFSINPRVACTGSYVYCLWTDNRTGSVQPYFNYSSDGGQTWQNPSTMLSPGTASWSNLSISGGLECTGTYVYTCWTDDRTGQDEVYFNRSTNYGASWGSDMLINESGNLCAMPDMDIEGSHVYIAWQDNRNTGGLTQPDIYFDYSSDFGATWQAFDIGPLDALAVGLLSSGPSLESEGSVVYATWNDQRIPPGEVFFSRSTDNGATWSPEVHINIGTLPFGIYGNLPVMAAGNGGWVNIAWGDPRYTFMAYGVEDIMSTFSSDYGVTWPSSIDEADVFAVRSTDAGLTWSSPVRVNDDTTKNAQVLPFVAVKADGKVDIAYYGFRLAPSLDPVWPGAEVRMAVSTNDAVSFGASFAIQDTVVVPLTQWAGEYLGVAVIDSFAYTVFTDNARTGNSDIWIDRTVNPSAGSYVYGDADGSGGVDIDDGVYLINFIFSSGPAPVPYASGDADCSTGVDIDDVVYIIAYIFSGGNAPGDPDGDGVPDC